MMSRFSGRQTDSRGLPRVNNPGADNHGAAIQDGRVLGTKKSNNNKGVMAARRAAKREEAAARNTSRRSKGVSDGST